MKKRIVLAIMICPLFLTACAKGTMPNNNIIEQKDVITLNILAGQSTSDAGIEDMIDEAIADKFPNVYLEWECVDWGERFDSQMQGRLAAGDVPDIIVGKAQDVYAYAASGNISPITIEGTQDIEETARSAVTIDGQIYGIPYNAWYQGVVYNKDIFQKLNLSIPQTHVELEDVTEKLKANNITPFAAHFQEQWKTGNMTMQFLINDIFRKEKNWGEQFRTNEISLVGNEAVMKCIMQNKFVLDNSWKDALVIEQAESDKRFAEEEAAMYLTGFWSLQSLNQYDSAFKYGIFPYPNEEGDSCLIKETNMTFMMSSTTEQKDLISQIFEELLQNEKLMNEILSFTQTYPVIEGFPLPYESVIEEDIKAYEQKGQVVDATIGNNELIWKYQNNVAGEILKYLKGEKTIEEVLKFAEDNKNDSAN